MFIFIYFKNVIWQWTDSFGIQLTSLFSELRACDLINKCTNTIFSVVKSTKNEAMKSAEGSLQGQSNIFSTIHSK